MEKVTIPEGTKGLWTVSRFEISQNEATLSIIGFGHRAPNPGVYTKLSHKQYGVVMSDTTAEQRDHYLPVAKAKGSCLINGLGIGMVLHNILLKPDVTDVTVVEVDKDVIDLVGPHYSKDPRVTIIHANAFDYQPPKGKRYNMVWHDIWNSICSDNNPEMCKLHRKYGRKADWQGSWGREEMRRDIRESKRSRWFF